MHWICGKSEAIAPYRDCGMEQCYLHIPKAQATVKDQYTSI